MMATWRLSPFINTVNLLCARRLTTTQDSITSKFKRNIEKDILPPKPKKPLSPFLQYLQSVRHKLQKEHPDLKYQDIIKKASEQWTHVESTIKQNLQKQYTEQHFIYKQKLEDYKNSLTDDQKILIEKTLMEKESVRKKNEVKQKLVELGKPKRPLSAFFLFMQNKIGAKDPHVSHQDWLHSVSNEWKNMTTEAKNKYITEATQLYEKYKIELKKWEKDMIQADFLNIGIQDKTDIKTGWGTDTTCYKTRSISDGRSDQRCEAVRSLTLYSDKSDLRAIMKYLKNVRNGSINDVKPIQLHNTKMYKYFISIWRKFVTILKEAYKNWKVKHTNGS